jgi:hypothetical protein
LAFNNDILAGSKLIRQTMESENYVAGTSGWQLTRDGNAELNDVTVRGVLESPNYVPGTSGWHLDNDGSAEMRSLTMQGSWRVENALSDPAYIEGGILGNIPYVKFNGLLGLNEYSALMQAGEVSGRFRWRQGIEPQSSQATLIHVKDLGIGFQKSPGGETVMFLNDRGIIVNGSWSPWVEETWHDMLPSTGAVSNPGHFVNAWHNAGGNWNSAGYRKMPDGTVMLRGGNILNGTSRADGTIIATLPVGYRPSADLILMGGNASAAGFSPSVRIFWNTGDIQIFGMAASTSGAHSWDGIKFDTALLF